MLRLWGGVFALGLVGCDSSVLVVADAGVADTGIVDAGARDGGVEEVDSGVDAGVFFDAGPRPDAGFPDAGPPLDECGDLVFNTVSHTCEGDEDACEPVGDLGAAGYDVLAVWSRIEDDDLIIQVLFRGLPLVCSGLIWIGVRCTENPSLVFFSNNEQRLVTEGVVVSALRGIENGRFVRAQQSGVLNESQGVAEVRLGAEGHLVEVRTPLALLGCEADPDVFVGVNFTNDDPHGDEGVNLGGPSRGGRMDGIDPLPVGELCLVPADYPCAFGGP